MHWNTEPVLMHRPVSTVLCKLCVHYSTIASREKEELYAVLSETFMKKAILCQSIDSLE